MLTWTGGPLEYSGMRGRLEVARVRLTRSEKWCVYSPEEGDGNSNSLSQEKIVALGLETLEKAKERAERDLN